MDYLLDNVERISSRITSFKAHETAVGTLTGTAKAELAVAVTSPGKQRRATVTASPVRRQKSEDKRTVGRRRSSDGLNDSPFEQLLGELGLVLPVSDDPEAAGNNAQTQVAFLSTTLSERSNKAAGVAQNVQGSFEGTAASQLADARRALQLIRDSVLAESPFGEVHLVDPGIEGSIAVLAQEVHNVSHRLEEAEKDMTRITRGRNVKRDELIGRWGR